MVKSLPHEQGRRAGDNAREEKQHAQRVFHAQPLAAQERRQQDGRPRLQRDDHQAEFDRPEEGASQDGVAEEIDVVFQSDELDFVGFEEMEAGEGDRQRGQYRRELEDDQPDEPGGYQQQSPSALVADQLQTAQCGRCRISFRLHIFPIRKETIRIGVHQLPMDSKCRNGCRR
jgi:hypothetical protein